MSKPSNKKVLSVEPNSEPKPDSDSDEGNEIMMLGCHHEQATNCQVLELHVNKIKRPYCQVEINGNSISMMADSGSFFTLIGPENWKKLTNTPLRKSFIKPVAYGGKSVQVVGEFDCNLAFKGHSTQATIYVAEDEASLLGWLEQKNLGIILDPNSQEQVLLRKEITISAVGVTMNDWKASFPTVFNETLGCIKGFSHQIMLKQGAQPVVHKPRRVPLAMRKELDQELNTLCDQGIKEPIECSEWLSPIVLARKPSGALRMCCDLRDLNDNIWVDRHPLPNITEMLSSLKDAKIFTTLDMSSAYHQIRLKKESRHLTSFVTPTGAYR